MVYPVSVINLFFGKFCKNSVFSRFLILCVVTEKVLGTNLFSSTLHNLHSPCPSTRTLLTLIGFQGKALLTFWGVEKIIKISSICFFKFMQTLMSKILKQSKCPNYQEFTRKKLGKKIKICNDDVIDLLLLPWKQLTDIRHFLKLQ